MRSSSPSRTSAEVWTDSTAKLDAVLVGFLVLVLIFIVGAGYEVSMWEHASHKAKQGLLELWKNPPPNETWVPWIIVGVIVGSLFSAPRWIKSNAKKKTSKTAVKRCPVRKTKLVNQTPFVE